jgi:hypothetical protein
MLDIDKLVERASELYTKPVFSLWAEQWLDGSDRTESTILSTQQHVRHVRDDLIGGMYWTLDAAYLVAKAARLRRNKSCPEETVDQVRIRILEATALEEQALRSATVAARLIGGEK